MYNLNSPNQRPSSINHYNNQNPHLSYFGGSGSDPNNTENSVLNSTAAKEKNNSNSKSYLCTQ